MLVTCRVLGEEKFFTQLLVGTLGIIFFAIFFREPPRIVKVCYLYLLNDKFLY